MTTAEHREAAKRAELRIAHEHLSSEMTVVTLSGEADVYSAPRLREVLRDVIEHGRHRILVEMSAVEMLDSTALGVLVGALKRTRAQDGFVGIVGATERILKSFRISGLIKVFPIYGCLSEAEEKLPHLAAVRTGRSAGTNPVDHAAGLRIRHEHSPSGLTVVTVAGDADAHTSRQLRAALVALIDDGHVQLLIDMKDMSISDGSGFGALVGALKRTRALGGYMGVVAPSRKVLHVFRATGLTKVLPIYGSLAEAEEKLPAFIANMPPPGAGSATTNRQSA
ncbi:STAS domain-containing protein [Streptomyces boluensis]|uniref:Anti-sigma factor antagonist n=1 Tax=Streptomyces boluensis TaxID=1775135 RepID=A0A964XML8_9ACTN|nr:STAS domain-containing protein [Streptomyces boluensis]NBE54535.1 anti-sigma factor antagonist [Streptomyces boluensis]